MGGITGDLVQLSTYCHIACLPSTPMAFWDFDGEKQGHNRAILVQNSRLQALLLCQTNLKIMLTQFWPQSGPFSRILQGCR